MNGVEALRAVLVADAAVTALVPADRIVEGVEGLGLQLPAIVLESLSDMDVNISSPGDRVFVSERVQATVLAATNDQRTDVLAAVKRAGAHKRFSEFGGLTNLTIQTAGKGPSVMSDSPRIYSRNQDFMVRFNEER